jgi:hypothetical protein
MQHHEQKAGSRITIAHIFSCFSNDSKNSAQIPLILSGIFIDELYLQMFTMVLAPTLINQILRGFR